MLARTAPSSVSVLALLLVASACALPQGDAGSPGNGAYMVERPDAQVQVLLPDGGPLADAVVWLEPVGRDAVTDADGVAIFLALAPGDYTARASVDGYDDGSALLHVDETGGEAGMHLVATTDAGTTLAGTVTDADALPLEGAQVLVDGVEVATTDADGAYQAQGLDGGTVQVKILPPGGRSLLPWVIPTVELAPGASVTLFASLAGLPPDGAGFMGSTYCGYCHTEQAAAWSATAHGISEKDPAVDPGPAGLSDAFTAGQVVDLANGATVELGTSGSTWIATVVGTDGSRTAALPVVGVAGGGLSGAALAVELDGSRAVLPVAWALAGQGLGSAQAPAGMVEGWSQGWFDGAGSLDIDPGAVSWDLQCGGCHSTGMALQETAGTWSMQPVTSAGTADRSVGCESCHGPGSVHAASTGERAENIFNPARLPDWQRVEVCASCHERTSADAHPFSRQPGWPANDAGTRPAPWELTSDLATSAPVRWTGSVTSAVPWDQVGDFRTSPHQGEGFAGACEDCHDPHGTANPAMLRLDPGDNGLCIACHVTMFPDEAAQAEHAAHSIFDPGVWQAGTCTGCHMGRSALSLQPDAVSGAGEGHAHTLQSWRPDAALATFDEAGTDLLPLGAVPPGPCVDCHLQNESLAQDAGTAFPGPYANPQKRATYVDMQGIWDRLFGGGS